MNQKLINGDIRFRKLIENSYSGITLLDANFKVIYRSPYAETIIGWNQEDPAEISYINRIHPDDKLNIENILQSIQQNPGLSKTCIFRLRHGQGHDIWLESNYTNLLHEPGLEAIVCNFRDITAQKTTEHHLKLLESVITHTNDAVLITEAEPFDEPGPRILYVNDAFTRMTGYTAEEVIGKTPRILQGPKSDKKELKRLSDALRKWQPCEISTINYKKNGEEFWLNFSVSPVADEKGWYTHWISIDKDITQRKNEESQKNLLVDISHIFNQNYTLREALERILELLIDFGAFVLAEAWLIATDKRKIKLTAHCCKTTEAILFFNESANVKSFKPAEGLPGIAWETKTIQFWDNIDEHPEFARRDAAKKSGLKSAYGIPLFNNKDVVGVLVLGLNTNTPTENVLDTLIKEIGLHIGAEIKRKQLEEELSQIFDFAPDVICIAGIDGYFKKVNPALCNILEYTAQELISKPLIAFIHPDDQEEMTVEFNKLSESRRTFNFETRSISKTGKIKWLTWTSTPASEDGLLFCVARDVTEKKELEELLNKATKLARIGGWEIDLLKNTIIWSGITKEIHEVAPDFEPLIETAINFYKEGHDRSLIMQKMRGIIVNREPIDIQVKIVTPAGKTKWVRVIGEGEFEDYKCIKIHGSFQDIDALKNAEITANEALKEKNTILESIDDAFFAVDKHWIVTYWNSKAEKVLGKLKSEMLDHNLWDIFYNSVNSISYQKYNQAIETNQAVDFEDYYPPLKKWYAISAYPSDNGLSVYFKDITERKLSENLLKDSEKRYSELFQLSPIPNWVYDQDTLRFLDVNKAAINHYGYSRKEFLSMTIMDIRPPGEIIKLNEAISKPDKPQQLAARGLFIHQKKNGELIRVDIQSNPIKYKGKNAKVIIANDITERLNYIKAIEDQNEKLREVSWMQSHVIRAPLARMMGLIDLVKITEENSDRELIMQHLLTSADELDHVIRSITDMSKINPGTA
ncbi:MAG: PAS domain S-box protein [Bacteroidota bacterium]